MAGLGALLLASEVAFTVVKWGGAVYLLWLAYETWRAPVPVAIAASDQARIQSRRRVFSTGYAVSISNPKALIFFATFLPQFMRPDDPLFLQFLILASTFAVMQLAYEVGLALTARRLGSWLIRNGRAFNRVTAGVFVGIAGMVLASERTK